MNGIVVVVAAAAAVTVTVKVALILPSWIVNTFYAVSSRSLSRPPDP